MLIGDHPEPRPAFRRLGLHYDPPNAATAFKDDVVVLIGKAIVAARKPEREIGHCVAPRLTLLRFLYGPRTGAGAARNDASLRESFHEAVAARSYKSRAQSVSGRTSNCLRDVLAEKVSSS